MADKKISDVPHDDSIGGSEKFPVDDAGVAKHATTGDVKNYVLAQIEALTAVGSVSTDNDKVYLLKDGALKPVSAGTLAAAILDYGFGKVAVAQINGNEVVGVKDSVNQKTITVSALKTWLEANMTVQADLVISSLASAALPLESGQYLVIEQGTGVNRANKRLTIANFASWVHERFASFVASMTAVGSVAGTDCLFIARTSNNATESKMCTVAQLKTFLGAGDVMGPAATTENKVPQWDSSTKTLKDGLSVVSTVSAETASGSNIPTAGAVKSAIDALDGAVVKTSGAQTVDGVKTFSSSPVVPTPTNNTDAVNKQYVDTFVPDRTVNIYSEQTIYGVKTFGENPIVNTPTEDGHPATKKYVDDNCVKLTGAQSVAGVKTFTSSPVVPTVAVSDNSAKASNTAWVIAKLSAWWTSICAAAQTISGAWTFSSSPVVPTPTTDMQAATKKYVDDNAVKLTGDQTVAGTKTFSASPAVPTVAEVSDDTTKAASTAFVHDVVEALDLRFKFVSKTFSAEGALTLDDRSINAFTLPVIPSGDTDTSYTVNMPTDSETHSRCFAIVLAVGSAASGSLKLKLETGPTYYSEASDTFAIAAGSYNLIMFREMKNTNEFLVSRRTLSATGTEFTGTIAQGE